MSSSSSLSSINNDHQVRTTRSRQRPPTNAHIQNSIPLSSNIAVDDDDDLTDLDTGNEDDDDDRPANKKSKTSKQKAKQLAQHESSSVQIIAANIKQDDEKIEKAKGKKKEEEAREPDDHFLASFQCPICLSPPIQPVLTPCGHILCGACLFSTLKTQAIRENRRPNNIGYLPPPPTRFGNRGKRGRNNGTGRVLTGSCPVCRHEIHEGMSTVPGEGGVKYLEVMSITEL